MPWIETIPFEAATGRLKKLYERIKGPNNNVDNIMMMHSLRPHTMEGHMAIYKNVLHHTSNKVPKWFLETLGVWVSSLNDCAYCVDHHFEGLKRLLKDDATAAALRKAIEVRDISAAPLDARQQVAMGYAEKLTRSPELLQASDIEALRAVGFDDGEILEINQVCAYFAYANRTVLGLGCSSEGDIMGLSPGDNDDPENWSHG